MSDIVAAAGIGSSIVAGRKLLDYRRRPVPRKEERLCILASCMICITIVLIEVWLSDTLTGPARENRRHV